MYASEMEQIERALETEKGLMERQELLKRLWRLDQEAQTKQEKTGVPTCDHTSAGRTRYRNGKRVAHADRGQSLEAASSARELLV